METKEIIDQNKPVSQTIDFYKIFKVFMSRWYWILGCIFIALIIAKVNIVYTKPYYQTMASIKIQESNPILNGPSQSTMVASYTDKILAEGYVIRSNDVVLGAIGNLDYKISYYLKGTIRTTEQYPDKPFKIEIIKQDSVLFGRQVYKVEYINNRQFGIKVESDQKSPLKQYQYGEPINMGNMIFRITSKIPSKGEYSFKFNSKDDFLSRVNGGLGTGEAARFTNVMNIWLRDENYTFAADILNEITKKYIDYDISQKQKSAKQIVDFIDKQLDLVTSKADSSSKILSDFKTSNEISDVSGVGTAILAKKTETESQRENLKIEMLGITQLEMQVNNPLNKISPNLNIEGIVSPTAASLILEFNKLVGDRETKLSDFGEASLPVKEIDDKLASLRRAIQKNIDAFKTRNLTTLKYLEDKIAQLNVEVKQLPVKEQTLVKLASNFQVNNRVQDYLKEKRLEAEMNAAATVAGAVIVNKAIPNTTNMGVNPNSIYTYAIMLGLACGAGLILLVRFLNPYIYDKETVEALTKTPIIGVIRKFPEYIDKNNRQALSLAKPKSVFAESVRSVRTNLSFMASHKKSKTICITSEISGEGKSFVTVNLAGTLALIDKRVVLVAADLRKSKLHKAFGSDNKVGLSTYLAGHEELKNIILHDSVHNIDFIPSGPVPPNPSELLHTEKMSELLKTLSAIYDYVLVDTAPVGLVSDAIPLIRQSDINIFVIRSGKSLLRAAAIPERLSREYGLSNLAIVLNAFGDDSLHANYYTTDYSRGGGNSTYYYSDYSGYAGSGYYDNDPKKWWEFWKKK